MDVSGCKWCVAIWRQFTVTSALCSGTTPEEAPPDLLRDMQTARQDIAQLRATEAKLEEDEDVIQESLRTLVDGVRGGRAYVTQRDIWTMPEFDSDTLIAIRAPTGSTLVVPDPNTLQTSNTGKRFNIFLRSASGPIDALLIGRPTPEQQYSDALLDRKRS